MLKIEDLISALNNPQSPMREKLLNSLSLSPLDPAAAYSEILKSETGGFSSGAVENPRKPEGVFNELLTGEKQSFPELGPLQPIAPSQTTRPFEFDYTDQNSIAGMANAAGQLMPGEQGGVPTPDTGLADAMKMLGGLGGLGGQEDTYQQPPYPSAPSPRGNNWNTLKVDGLQTPAVKRLPTLSELLGR